MMWGCRQPNHDLSFLFAHSFDWDAKKDTRTKTVTRAVLGVVGEGVGTRPSVELDSQDSRSESYNKPLLHCMSNPWLRWSCWFNLQQNDQAIKTNCLEKAPHPEKHWLKGMHFNQFVPFRYVSTTFLQVGLLVRDKSWTGKHLSNGEHFADLRYYIKWVTTF